MGGQVTVVGGLGLIGSEISTALRRDGWTVVVVAPERDRAGVRYGDMLDPDSLPDALAGSDIVVQCANFPGYPVERPQLRYTFENFDAHGTESLVAAAEAVGCKRYLYVSGVGVPSTKPYFRAMRRGERAVLNSSMEGVCLRPTLVYGPNDRTLNRIVAAGRQRSVIPLLGTGNQLQQPIYLGDVGEIARQAVPIGGPGGVFEIGGPDRMTADTMVRTVLDLAGVSARPLRIPLGFARLVARMPWSALTVAAVDFAGEDLVADLTALRETFDVALTPFADGLGGYLGGPS
jgi:nucleoside-diphosphate-sugar epimerase